MKVKSKLKPQEIGSMQCSRMSKKAMMVECGLAFATFQLRPDRIRDARVTTIAKSDIRAGLQTAANVVKGLTEVDPFRAVLKPIQSGANRLIAELQGPRKDISVSTAPALLKKIEKLDAAMKKAWDEIERSCNR